MAINQGYPQVKAFVLHSRAYRENSQIVQLFSREVGRFSVIAKGIKGKSSQAKKALLQPFIPLQISYAGKSDLKTLVQCEFLNADENITPYIAWQGKALACGYYANELILRSCAEYYDYPQLFKSYCSLIKNLSQQTGLQEEFLHPALRKFEVMLLTELGVAPDWRKDIYQHDILSGRTYQFIARQGFRPIEERNYSEQQADQQTEKYQQQKNVFSGKAILNLLDYQFDSQTYKNTQKITAMLLQEIIGDKPLQSRKLWQHIQLQN